MKFINPSEISAKILTLIADSKEKLIIISPFVKISKWIKMENQLKAALSRGVDMEIYVREGNRESYVCLDELDFKYHGVRGLHAKLYLNESYAIITSLNLLLSSEMRALELGHITETEKEYEDLLMFYKSHIALHGSGNESRLPDTGKEVVDFMSMVQDEIYKLQPEAQVGYIEETLWIKLKDFEMSVSVDDGEQFFMRVACTVTGRNAETVRSSFDFLGTYTGLDVQLEPGRKKGSVEFMGRGQQVLETSSILRVQKDEADYLRESVLLLVKSLL